MKTSEPVLYTEPGPVTNTVWKAPQATSMTGPSKAAADKGERLR